MLTVVDVPVANERRGARRTTDRGGSSASRPMASTPERGMQGHLQRSARMRIHHRLVRLAERDLPKPSRAHSALLSAAFGSTGRAWAGAGGAFDAAAAGGSRGGGGLAYGRLRVGTRRLGRRRRVGRPRGVSRVGAADGGSPPTAAGATIAGVSTRGVATTGVGAAARWRNDRRRGRAR